MTVVVIMGNNQVVFYVAFTCFMWIVLLLNTKIIAKWQIYQTVWGPALPDIECYRKGIGKCQNPYDVNPNDVELFVNEIYSPGGSDHHAHATFNTSRPITKHVNDVDLFVNEIYSPGGSDLHAHATFNTSRPITKPHWKYYLTVREYALPDTGCNGKRMVHVEFLAPDAYLRFNQTVRGPALPERGCDSVGIYEYPFLNITNQTEGQQLEIVYYRHERNKMGKLRFLDVVKPDKSVDTFRIVKEAYSPDERDIKIHYTSCSNTAHTRLKGKEPNSIFECISVVILWCAFEVIWITYYMQDRQAVTHKELSLTDTFSKKGGTGTACSDLNETSGGLMAQPMNDILNIQSDDIVLLNVQKHTNKT